MYNDNFNDNEEIKTAEETKDNNEEIVPYAQTEETSYDYGDDEGKPWLKIVLGVVAIIIIILIILLLLKACGGGDTKTPVDENDKASVLIEAAKDYYEKYENELPGMVGECVTVTLEVLLNENLISKPALFDDCNKTNTFVTVCATNDGHSYEETLSCGAKIKYYYPDDETDATLVKEFYISAPHVDYTLFDNETDGVAKWYTESSDEKYYNGYASEAPKGYPNRGEEGNSVTKVSVDKPTEEEYRTIREVTLYSTRTKTTPTSCNNPTEEVVGTPTEEAKMPYDFGYTCASEVRYCVGTETVFVPYPNTCESSQTDLTFTCGKAYTCNGTDVTNPNIACSTEKTCATGKLNADGTKCVVEKCSEEYTNWSSWTTTKCVGSSDVCKSTQGYSYTDRVWRWYQAAGRSYYPSGSATADEENTYYLEAPVEGAIKDLDTITTGYKYYRLAY